MSVLRSLKNGDGLLADVFPILVVDGRPEICAEVSQSLQTAGYRVETVVSGPEAYERFISAKYSLVIADEGMSGIDGQDLLTSLKEASPPLPVIITTANGSVNNAVKAMLAGASDYLLKPFSMESLTKTVQKTLDGSNGLSNSPPVGNSPDLRTNGKEIITCNSQMRTILKQVRAVAPSNATVLILGESGTGKELLAAYVHRHSRHPEAPYVALNCAALPDTLAESELFGHEKGSFTGAVRRKIGKFEQASKGTVVLDEISEMPLHLQAKLLRVLQEKEVDRIGGARPVAIDARMVAISNVDLKTAVADGKFREDLYYRINVIPLILPPLRDRKEDIELLANHFLAAYAQANQKKVVGLDSLALNMLLGHNWPGNVRELQNVIERAVLIGDGPAILPEHLLLESPLGQLQPVDRVEVKAGYTVKQMEKTLIFETLKEVNDNRTRAAELLGISIRTLRNKLNEYKQEAATGA